MRETGHYDTNGAVCRAVAGLRDDAHLVPDNLRDWWLNYLDTHSAHFHSVMSRLPQPHICGRLLEVGCVPGHLTVLLSVMGYDACGVDIGPARLADLWAHHSVDVRKVDIETEALPFDDGTFDTVLFTEILEHLRVHPIFALRETSRVLKPRGRLILSVPNITPLERIKFLLGGDYQGDIIAEFDKLERFGHMGHFRLYSSQEVDRILRHVHYADIDCLREGPLRTHWVRYALFPWRNAFRSHVYFVAYRKG